MSQAETPKDGGPAFPISDPDIDAFKFKTTGELRRLMSGMAMREYAAINIMAGLASNPAIFQQDARCGFSLANATFDQLGELAASLADSVLKARQS